MISNVGTNDVVPQEYVERGYERRGSPNNVERRYERRGSQNVERRYEWRGSPHDKFISNVGTNDVVPRKMHYQFNYKPHSRPKELKSSLRCFDVRLSLWICEPKLVTNSPFNVIWCSISFDYEAFGEPCHPHTRVRHIFTRDTFMLNMKWFQGTIYTHCLLLEVVALVCYKHVVPNHELLIHWSKVWVVEKPQKGLSVHNL